MSKRLGRGIDLFLEKQNNEEIFRKTSKFEEEEKWLFAFHLTWLYHRNLVRST